MVDHVMVADAFAKLLEPEYEVMGTVQDGRALVDAAERLNPDVIIADIAMPLMNGLDACEQIKQKHPKIRIVYLTMDDDKRLAAEAFRRGASGYLLKASGPPELPLAMQTVLKGKKYVSPMITRDLVGLLVEDAYDDPATVVLTERQREVIQLLVQGHSMKEVASILHISCRTVAFHKYKVMSMLGLKNNAELIQYAIRKRLVLS
jgi:DNA-binding NarL/FixJ family response regulator